MCTVQNFIQKKKKWEERQKIEKDKMLAIG